MKEGLDAAAKQGKGGGPRKGGAQGVYDFDGMRPKRGKGNQRSPTQSCARSDDLTRPGHRRQRKAEHPTPDVRIRHAGSTFPKDSREALGSISKPARYWDCQAVAGQSLNQFPDRLGFLCRRRGFKKGVGPLYLLAMDQDPRSAAAAACPACGAPYGPDCV